MQASNLLVQLQEFVHGAHSAAHGPDNGVPSACLMLRLAFMSTFPCFKCTYPLAFTITSSITCAFNSALSGLVHTFLIYRCHIAWIHTVFANRRFQTSQFPSLDCCASIALFLGLNVTLLRHMVELSLECAALSCFRSLELILPTAQQNSGPSSLPFLSRLLSIRPGVVLMSAQVVLHLI